MWWYPVVASHLLLVPASQGPTYVGGSAASTIDDAGTSTTIAATLGAAVAIDDVVVGMAGGGGASTTDLTGVADTLGNTYTLHADKTTDTTSNGFSRTWRSKVTNAGTPTITVTYSQVTANRRLIVAAWRGAAVAPFDTSVGNWQLTPGTGVDAVTSSAITTATNNELCIGFHHNSSEATPGTGALTAGTNYQSRLVNTAILMVEDRVLGTAGSIAATFSLTVGHSTITHVVAIKAVAAPSNDAVGTEAGTVTDAVTGTTLAAISTESLVVSETQTATLAAVATETLTVSEAGLATSGSSNQVGVDQGTITETQVTLAAVVATQALTITETVGTVPLILVATDSLAVTETPLATLLVTATDSAVVTESAATTLTSGANISASDSVMLSEVALATLAGSASESLVLTETSASNALLDVSEAWTLDDSGTISNTFSGIAAGLASLSPRFVTGAVGQKLITWDTTYVTFDNADVTWDGAFVGAVAESGLTAPTTDATLLVVEGSPTLVGV